MFLILFIAGAVAPKKGEFEKVTIGQSDREGFTTITLSSGKELRFIACDLRKKKNVNRWEQIFEIINFSY